ncbi:hypothetical protein C7W88_22140 (plasmid) [Novosphingobium sp. THN1]|nr:hypothetical protein C7W88_22140 [Novosphingobium sp. THN1]
MTLQDISRQAGHVAACRPLEEIADHDAAFASVKNVLLVFGPQSRTIGSWNAARSTGRQRDALDVARTRFRPGQQEADRFHRIRIGL